MEDISKILRICRKCGKEKPLERFCPNKQCNYGRSHTCLDCYHLQYGKEYYQKIYSQPKIVVEKKTCRKCGIEKDIHQFHKKNQNKDGYSNVCSECQAQYIRAYKNTESGMRNVKKGRKKYYDNNKHKWVEYRESEWYKNYRNSPEYKKMSRTSQRAYYDLHKKELNQLANEIHKRRKDEDPSVLLASIIRSQVHNGIDKKKFNLSTQEIIGCDFEFFKYYMECKFEDGMTWETHCQFGWHADHIIPVSSFDLTKIEEIKKCFHYSNYQPLWWWDNLSKGSKIITLAA